MKKIIITQRTYRDIKTDEIRDTLDVRLSNFLIQSKLIPVIIPNYISLAPQKYFLKYLNELKPDGLLLSGGEDFGVNKIRDNIELKLLKYFTKKHKPILGICRGMLLIGKFFNSKIKKVKNHVKTRHKSIIVTNDKLFPKTVNSYHNYTLKSISRKFVVTVKSQDNEIEAIKHVKFKYEGWMWHPEREKKFNIKSKKRIIKIFG